MENDGLTVLLCADVRRWMEQQLRNSSPLPEDSVYCDHIAGCTLCRGTLASLAGIAIPPTTIDCEQCLQDLPAFIDHVASDEMAFRLYPDVSWHLWTCANCADTYLMTRSLLVELADEPEPVTTSSQPTRSLPNLLYRVSRDFLHVALLPVQTTRYGVARGGSGDVIIGEEDMPDGRVLTLRVTEQHDGAWRIGVSILPPISGRVVLDLGSVVYRVPLDTHGDAVIADVPSTIVAAPDGPDLTIRFEEDET